MNKIFQVALREFLSTIATKGFIVGVLIMPIMVGVFVLIMPILINESPPKIDGELAIVDPTGSVAPGLRAYVAPEAIAERRGQFEKKIEEATPEQLRGLTTGSPQAQQALDAALGEIPRLEVTTLDPRVDPETEKTPLLGGSAADGGRLALIVVAGDAVRRPSEDAPFGTYELFVREKLDDRIIDEIKDGMRTAIVDARVEAAGLDRGRIDSLTSVGRIRATTVTEKGEKTLNEAAQIFIPMGFMLLLLASVFTGGQYLMTTTIEEKSSRVIEVLLSAVSPMQLMTGKIVGQMFVGFTIIALYAGMGISALISFALLGLLEPWLLIYLVIFYLISYFVIGSFMAAIGAAVNEPREAQSLMLPVIGMMMIPWVLWLPISRNPDSIFSVVASFLPPVNSFVMLLRMTSSTPPPMWQVWVSIAIGVASIYGAVWFSAKVFRVGLLLHGTPPSFATLIKWVRMA